MNKLPYCLLATTIRPARVYVAASIFVLQFSKSVMPYFSLAPCPARRLTDASETEGQLIIHDAFAPRLHCGLVSVHRVIISRFSELSKSLWNVEIIGEHAG